MRNIATMMTRTPPGRCSTELTLNLPATAYGCSACGHKPCRDQGNPGAHYAPFVARS